MTEYSERHEDVREIVARRIKAVRGRRGFSLRELSRRLGEIGHSIDASALMRLERAERRPTVEDLLAIAAALDVSPVSLAMPDGELDHVLVGNVPVISHQARAWWRGFTPVEGYAIVGEDGEDIPGLDTDERIFYSEVPQEEWHAFREPGVRPLLESVMGLIHTAGRVRGIDDPYSSGDEKLLATAFRTVEQIARHHAEMLEKQQEGGER